MFIYKIQLSQEDILVGYTYRSIAKKRWGHLVCGKNSLTSCTLYNRMRVLNISPTELRLEILEVIEDSDTMHERRDHWSRKLGANLDECRAHMYIDGETVISKRNMECECQEKEFSRRSRIGKPYLLTFD